jgi:small-conductance mechanosensitive channel
MLIKSLGLVGWFLIVFLGLPLLVKKLSKIAKKTKSKLDDIIVNSFSPGFLLILMGIGLIVWSDVIEWKGEQLKYVRIVSFIMMGLGAVLFLDKLLRNWIKIYSKDVIFVKTSGNLIKTLFRVVMLLIVTLIVLDSIGVSITPVIASLGVGSVAIALALQETLSNIFSGIHILIDKPIKVGDFIRLDSGVEGYVTKIGWRSTRLKMLPNNEIIIPNSKLANTQLINYHSPEEELSLYVTVGVSYESDLEHVEKVTIEVAKEVLKEVEGGVSNFEPFIRYHTFDSSSINFTAILRAKEFSQHYRIKHEFIKRLHKRYNEEGIIIPFPIRTLHLPKKYTQEIITELK